MNMILELQVMETVAPARANAGPDSTPFSTVSFGALCLTSTISLSWCVP
jgi:hypothetical protein